MSTAAVEPLTFESLSFAEQTEILDRFRDAERIERDGTPFAQAKDPWQVEERFHLWHRKDHRGDYEEAIRGMGKTADVAWFCLERIVFFAEENILCAAADVDQAALVFDSINGYLRRNPALRKNLKVGKAEIVNTSNGSRIQRISSDVGSSFGLRPTFLIADELTNWTDPEFWFSLYSSMGKIPGAKTIIISNAGRSKTLWSYAVREMARTHPEWEFRSRSEPLSWMDAGWIETQRQTLPDSVFRRLFENEWVGQGVAFSEDDINLALDPEWSPQTKGASTARYYLGLDIGLKKDRTAIVVCHKGSSLPPPERSASSDYVFGHRQREWLDAADKAENTIYLDAVRTFQGSREQPVDLAAVEETIVQLHRAFDCRILADPYQAQQMLQNLRAKHIYANEWVFAPSNISTATTNLIALFRQRRLKMFFDPILDEELRNLVLVETAWGWKLDHTAQGHNDATTALMIASLAAVESPGTRKIPPGTRIVRPMNV